MPSIVKLTLESNQYERNIKNAQKQLNDFTRAIGINMKSLSGMTLAAGAVTGALKVAKDAFNSSRDMVDEWGRTMQSAQSLYNGFLNALNTGDFSGFINNMASITQAAREAYDAVSDLELLNAYNAGSLQKAKTGFTGSVADFRMGEGTADNVKAAAETLKKQLRERKDAELNALKKAVNAEALNWGLNGEELSKALEENFGDFVNRMHSNKPESYTGKSVVPMWGSGTVAGAMSGTFSPVGIKKVPGTTDERLSDFARRVTPETMQKLRKYEVMSAATEEEIRQIDKQVSRMLGKAAKSTTGGGGKTGSTKTEIAYASDSIMAQEKLVAELTQKWKTAGEAVRDDYKVQLDEAKKQLEQMANPSAPEMKLWQGDIDDMMGGPGKVPSIAGGIPQIGEGLKNVPELLSPLQQINAEIEEWQRLMQYAPTSDIYQDMAKHLDELIKKQNEFTDETVKIVKSANITADVVGSIGDAFNAIEDPAAKVMGTVMQAIASVALGYAQATVQASELGPWAWIAFAASGLATMIATISSIHSATGYATGGEVQGNSYSGDNIPIMANAGEVVLTKAMTRTLAANLQGNGIGNMNLRTKVKGTELLVWLDNSLAQSGRGELVTWGQ